MNHTKMDFKCKTCESIFESEGRKIEFNDPAFGPCWKMVADCPGCGDECDEFRRPKQSGSKHQGACEMGSSCCMGGNCNV